MESIPVKKMKHLMVQETRIREKGTLSKEKSTDKEIKIKLEISPKMIKNIILRVEEL